MDFAKDLELTINKNGFEQEIDPEIPVIVVIGNTGVGKSTLINYLCGSDYYWEIKRNKKFKRDNNSEPEKVNVGNSNIDSATIVSQPVYSEQLGCYLLDTPGFEDSRGDEQKTINNINIDISIKRFKYIKCVFLVYKLDSFISSRCKELKESLKLIENVFCRDKMSADQFKIILTQSNINNSEFYGKINDIFNELTGVTIGKPRIIKNINLLKNQSAVYSFLLKEFEKKLKTTSNKCKNELQNFQDKIGFKMPSFNLDILKSNSEKLYKILERKLLVHSEIEDADAFIDSMSEKYNLETDIDDLYDLRDQINYELYNNMIKNLEFLHRSTPIEHLHKLINQINTSIETYRLSLKPYFKYNDYICKELIKLFRCDYLIKIQKYFYEIATEVLGLKKLLNESLKIEEKKLNTLETDLKLNEGLKEQFVSMSISNTKLVYTYEPYKDTGFFYGMCCSVYDLFANEYMDHSLNYEDEIITVEFTNGISYLDKKITHKNIINIEGVDNKKFYKNTDISFNTKYDDRYKIKIEFYNLSCNTYEFRNKNANYINKIKNIKNSITATENSINTINTAIKNNLKPSDTNIHVFDRDKLQELSNMLNNIDGFEQLKMLARLRPVLDYQSGSLHSYENKTGRDKLQKSLDKFNDDLVKIVSSYGSVIEELKTDIVCACMSRDDRASKECPECNMCVDLGRIKELTDLFENLK